ncbi:chromate resistance protein ChrB domain-containing protein [Rhodoblastus sp.]|uniref:chromate resistance protein ChrB domain-containing protein n=1 Tax=Rhodoblastus sp. TaxID=1962975 RepID=UPI0035AE4A72
MSAFLTISPEKLLRLLGAPKGPVLVDVRSNDDFEADPRLIPGSLRRDASLTATWATSNVGRAAIVISRRGAALGPGVAAQLRAAGVGAETLAGGFDAWTEAGYPTISESKLPRRDALGRTVWVTRARPKVDRIACPWLIRRFIDPEAVFLFVAPSDVASVAKTFDAVPFDIEGAFWGHRGEKCSFDAFIDELGLHTEELIGLAEIVRGADTGRPELTPESPGLLAFSLGLSRLHADDHEQLEAGMAFYDALYRWRRDAIDEAHNHDVTRLKSGKKP